jgi:hypothetical protein
MMSSAPPEWIAAPDRVRGTVLCGVPTDELTEAIFSLPPGAIEIVALRDLADQIAMQATLDRRPKPAIRISRDLASDVEALLEAGAARTIIYDATPILAHVGVRRSALAAETRLLAGYDIDADLVGQFALADTAYIVDTLRTRHGGALILHDPERRLPSSVLRDARLIDGPEPAPPPPSPSVQAAVPNVVPTAALVIAHAKFLADTPLDTLIVMHRRFAGARFADIFAIWRRNIELLELTLQGGEFRQPALARLAALQERLDPNRQGT